MKSSFFNILNIFKHYFLKISFIMHTCTYSARKAAILKRIIFLAGFIGYLLNYYYYFNKFAFKLCFLIFLFILSTVFLIRLYDHLPCEVFYWWNEQATRWTGNKKQIFKFQFQWNAILWNNGVLINIYTVLILNAHGYIFFATKYMKNLS